jgi:hypothetical protein
MTEKEEDDGPPNAWRNRNTSQEQVYTENQDSSSSGGNVSTPAEINAQQEKMYLEEIIRQQNKVISNLRSKINSLEARLRSVLHSVEEPSYGGSHADVYSDEPIYYDPLHSQLRNDIDNFGRPRHSSEPVNSRQNLHSSFHAGGVFNDPYS